MQNKNLQFALVADHDLVLRSQSGDNAAFAELIERHHNSCSKLALSILRDKSDAEDEVQNACWKAFEHIRQFQQDAKFSTWLTRIVVNQCLMRLRQTRRAKFFYVDEAMTGEEAAKSELRDKGYNPEEQLGKNEVAEILRAEIHRIPPLLRHVFLLRDVQHLPMQQVADSLQISLAAAKSRLLRARAELRSRLGRHCGRVGAATLTA